MSQTAHQPHTPGSPEAVLASVRAARHAEQAATTQVLTDAVEWAGMHEVPAGEGDTYLLYGQSIPLAGPGAPEIAEHAVAEFATVAEISTDAGRALIGQALELAYRLPETWKQVQALQVPAWIGRRVAQHTIALSKDAAGFVDRQVAAVAGKIGPVQLDRLITEARRRYMPDTLDEPTETYQPDTRHVSVHGEDVSFNGTVRIDAELDLGDAYDLDTALSATAQQLKDLGSPESLDVRRAAALGELARHQPALDLTNPDHQPEPTAPSDPTALHSVESDERVESVESADSVESVRRSAGEHCRRPITLYLHLSEDALTAAAHGGVGRCENTRTPIDPDTIRTWCGNPDAVVTVKPVIDLTDHIRVDQYEIPDRLKERTDLRDVTCCFPWCTRPARRCDHDHAIPHDTGGSTCSCNIAALCRHHHRLKTHTAWRYKILEPGLYLWTSPHGYMFLRDHTGTTDVTPAGLIPIPGCPDQPPDQPDPPEQ